MEEFERMKERLRDGEALEVSTGGGAYQVWCEPYATPPSVYYEGHQYPLSQLNDIVQNIVRQIQENQVRIRWVTDDD